MRRGGAPSGDGAGRRSSRVSGTGRVWILNLALAGLSLGLYLAVVQHLGRSSPGFRIPWWGLAAMFYVVEAYVVHLQFGREAESFSLSELPLVLGLFFATPRDLVVAQLLGAALALALRRRQSPLKLTFNLSHFCLETILAAMIFHRIVALGDAAGPAGWLATYLATLAAILVGVIAVVLAISLAEGALRVGMFPKVLGVGAIVTMTNTGLALVGVAIIKSDVRAAWLLIVPAATLFFAYRAYISQRHKGESLEFLYESTRTLQRSLKVEEAMSALLSQARQMFRAEIASITLFPGEKDDAGLRTTLGPGDLVEPAHRVALRPAEGVWARVASEGQAILLPRPIRNERLKQHFAAEGIRDAMVAPLHGESGVVGMLLVGNRLGDVSTFDTEDLKLFEMLANHASVSLENAGLVGRLEESLARLTELNRMKDEFVATVSHELRTPLTSIQGFLKTLLRPDLPLDPGQRRSFLEIVDRQSERLRRLIEDLLTVSRIESEPIQVETAQVSLPVLACRVVDEFASQARGHRFELRFDDDVPMVWTDEEMVRRIVSNLVDNALKYSLPNTRISVWGRLRAGGVVLSVGDEGFGVPAELRERIFERFYQVDQSATRQVGGAGLGLYISRRLAESLGGRLWLEGSAESGRGSVFSLWLPPKALGQPSTPGNDNRLREFLEAPRARAV